MCTPQNRHVLLPSHDPNAFVGQAGGRNEHASLVSVGRVRDAGNWRQGLV